MKIILNRDDIEEAIQAYVRDKFMMYGDSRTVNVVQGTKAMATVTLGEKAAQLPGLEDEPELDEEEEVTPEPMPLDKTDPFNIDT